MANSVYEVLLTESRLGPPPDDVDLTAGATVEFRGIVRELEGDREIAGIRYEAHTAMATHQLELVAKEAAEKFQLRKVIVHHRLGFVGAGEPSLFLRVKAPHRAAAFSAGQWIVDELKKRVPIWKHPEFEKDSGRASAKCNDLGPAPTLQP